MDAVRIEVQKRYESLFRLSDDYDEDRELSLIAIDKCKEVLGLGSWESVEVSDFLDKQIEFLRKKGLNHLFINTVFTDNVMEEIIYNHPEYVKVIKFTHKASNDAFSRGIIVNYDTKQFGSLFEAVNESFGIYEPLSEMTIPKNMEE